jgi:hypothetical protein
MRMFFGVLNRMDLIQIVYGSNLLNMKQYITIYLILHIVLL